MNKLLKWGSFLHLVLAVLMAASAAQAGEADFRLAENVRVVKSLVADIEANDKEKILSYFSPDSVFHNMPLDPVMGPDAIWDALAVVLEVSEKVDWVIEDMAVSDTGDVLTERTDRYLINGQWAEFKVMGIFEIKGGKIIHWREYFDLQQALDEMERVGEPAHQ